MSELDQPTKVDKVLDIADSCISRFWRACQRMTDRIHSLSMREV